MGLVNFYFLVFFFGSVWQPRVSMPFVQLLLQESGVLGGLARPRCCPLLSHFSSFGWDQLRKQ